MATIADLEGTVLNLIEEDPSAPVFWSLPNEVRVLLVEAINEAVLITGLPEIRTTALSLPDVSATIQTLPVDVLAVLKIERSGLVVPKTSMEILDKTTPGWENDVDLSGDLIHWFPFGLGQIGIYPKLAGGPTAITVTAAYVPVPITADRPYTGAEPVDFQQEYQDAFSQYAAGILRLKEGGLEFQQGISLAQFFIDKMAELSRFGYRTDDLRFSVALGSPSNISRVEKR